jgi:fructose-bisphosphate aldolase class II
MVTGDTKKRLDIERIRTIKEQTQVIMTLHGASGTDDGDLRRRHRSGDYGHTCNYGQGSWTYR